MSSNNTRRCAYFAAVAAALVTLTAPPASARYIEQSQVDLVHILAPPPAPSSADGQADIETRLAIQRARTPAEVASAQADDEVSVFRFADVMGPGFKPENLPFAAAFFKAVGDDGNKVLDTAKDYFKRPRPFVTDKRVEPVLKAGGTSYPSGAATFGTVAAILLADMVPEKAEAIFRRADQYRHNRVVAGIHYPTDVEAGRIVGTVIDNVLLHDQAFMADFQKAREEVRRAVGMP
jgi:acid phosphatase (class A)